MRLEPIYSSLCGNGFGRYFLVIIARVYAYCGFQFEVSIKVGLGGIESVPSQLELCCGESEID